MRMTKASLLLPLLALAFSTHSADALFPTRAKLLRQHAEKCLTEVKITGTRGGFCREFDSYSNYVFKGSTTTWVTFHIQNGDINKSNEHEVLDTLKKVSEAQTAGATSTR